jgi:hypothetical protein
MKKKVSELQPGDRFRFITAFAPPDHYSNASESIHLVVTNEPAEPVGDWPRQCVGLDDGHGLFRLDMHANMTVEFIPADQ